jgi:hypothetical protein
MPLQKRLPQK